MFLGVIVTLQLEKNCVLTTSYHISCQANQRPVSRTGFLWEDQGLELRYMYVYEKKGEALESILAHSCRSLSRFLKQEAARSISTSPGRDTSPSQVTSPAILLGFPNNSRVPIYTPGWREAL